MNSSSASRRLGLIASHIDPANEGPESVACSMGVGEQVSAPWRISLANEKKDIRFSKPPLPLYDKWPVPQPRGPGYWATVVDKRGALASSNAIDPGDGVSETLSKLVKRALLPHAQRSLHCNTSQLQQSSALT